MARQAGDGSRNWYAIHTYAGYEKAVIRNLKQRVESLGMQQYIFDAVVPTEKVTKIKGTKRVEDEEIVYPGYVLVDMIVNDESWYVVRNTPRVTGFVGTGVNPVPVSETEMGEVIKRMQRETTSHSSEYMADDQVSIIDGPFKDTEGKVLAFDSQTGKIKVMVSMFGRETELELDVLQVKPL